MLKILGTPKNNGPLWDDFFARTKNILPDLGANAQLTLIFEDKAQLQVHSSELTLKRPFYLDFTSDKLFWRILHSGRHSEAVARAVISNKEKPVVFDATAGLGRDSFILQCCGAQVTMFERNAVIWALLYDALLRAQKDENFCSQLKNGLPKLASFGPLYEHEEYGQAESIYYDPMFPTRRKSALVKQEMRILHVTVGADEDADNILPRLIQRSCSRVVVKRPAGAPSLGDNKFKVSGFVDGKACRFDIYSVTKTSI